MIVSPSRRGALALALGLLATAARATPMPARTRLLRGVAEGDQLLAGVEIALEPGWKTYWRVAGDSGIPPRFDFTASRNLAAAEVLYPAPARLSDGFGEILGYAGDVVFPVRVRPAVPGRPVHLAATLDYGVCERLCLPMQARLEAMLGASSGRADEALRVARALHRVPRPAAAGTAVPELLFDRPGRQLTLLAALPGEAVEHVVVEAVGGEPLPLPRLERLGDGRVRAGLRIEASAPGEILVTVIGRGGALEERRSLDG